MNKEQQNKNRYGFKAAPNFPKIPIDCIHKNKYLTSNEKCIGNSQMCEKKCSRFGHIDQQHQIIDREEFITSINLKKDKSIHITQPLKQRLDKVYLQVKTKINAVLEAMYTECRNQLLLLNFQDQDIKLIRLIEVGKFNSLCCSHIYYLNNIAVDERQFQRKGQLLINKLKNVYISSAQDKNSNNKPQNINKMLMQIRKQFVGKFNQQKKKLQQKQRKFIQRQKKLQQQIRTLKEKHQKQQKKLIKISTQMDQQDKQKKKIVKLSTLDPKNEPQQKKMPENQSSDRQIPTPPLNTQPSSSQKNPQQNITPQSNKNSYSINRITAGLTNTPPVNPQKNVPINKKLVDMTAQQMDEIKQKIAAKRKKRQQQKINQNQPVFLGQDKIQQRQQNKQIQKEKQKQNKIQKQIIPSTNKIEATKQPIIKRQDFSKQDFDTSNIKITTNNQAGYKPVSENKQYEQKNLRIGLQIHNPKTQTPTLITTHLKPQIHKLTPINQKIPIYTLNPLNPLNPSRKPQQHKVKVQNVPKAEENKYDEFGLYDPEENVSFPDMSQIDYIPKINQAQQQQLFHFKNFKPMGSHNSQATTSTKK